MEDLYERSCKYLNDVQKVQLDKLLIKHDKVFSKSGELGHTNLVFHEINTGDAYPCRQPARRLPYHRRQEAQNQIDEMFKAGVISPSSSPWASPIVLV